MSKRVATGTKHVVPGRRAPTVRDRRADPYGLPSTTVGGPVTIVAPAGPLAPSSQENLMEGNQGPRLFKVLRERGAQRRGWVEATVEDLTVLSGLDHHDVAKCLHQWNRQGLVKFTQHTNGTAHRMSAIRLTAAGMKYEYPEDRAMVAAPAPGEPRPVSTVAVEAPIIREDLDAKMGPARTPADESARQERAFVEAAERQKNTMANVASRRIADLEAEVERLQSRLRPDLTQYPLITALLGKRERLLASAAAIEADAPDIAEALLNRAAESENGLEREVLALVGSLTLAPDGPAEPTT